MQGHRRALVCISTILQRAHPHTLTPELQHGRAIPLIATVLHHTSQGGIADKAQWRAWCCRVMHYASLVDEACCSQVCLATPA